MQTKQEVVDDKGHEHQHTGGPLGEFAHRSHYHMHEHDHAAPTGAHTRR